MELRPCPSCNRHYGDEPRCPHCGSEAWRAPVLPADLHPDDMRAAAPKYGGPPLVRLGRFALLLAFFGALGALARWLARR